MAELLAPTRMTVDDVAALPYQEWVRYELIDGELYLSIAPHFEHETVRGNIFRELSLWSLQTGLGRPSLGIGIVFDPFNGVIPDVVWISRERLHAGLDQAGHLTTAPELVIEVLSPGRENARRDRDLKLTLYGQWDVQEYWIVDWRARQVQVYRQEEQGLHLYTTLDAAQELTSPLLPGFQCAVEHLFV